MNPCSFCENCFILVKLPVMEFVLGLLDDLSGGCAHELFWEFGCHKRFFE